MNTTGKSLFDSRLCQPCAAIFNGACFDPWSPQSSKSPDEGENVKSSLATHPRYHARTSIHSVSELWACASSLQCNICQFIWDRTRFRPSLPKLSEVLDRTVTATVFWANGPMNSKLQPAAIVLDMEMSFTITDFKVPGGSESGRICDLCLWPSSDIKHLITNMPLCSTTSSASTQSFMSSKLAECFADHLLCKRHTSSGHAPKYWPARLLHLGGSDHSTVTLEETTEWTEGVKYVTLSHRWGGVEFKTLTKSSKPEFQKGLDVDSLPRTFRETIHLVRQLGYTYLWIDSLCIIQDSTEDWQEQAPEMHNIYKNSTFTVSACCGNSQHGIFRDRNPQSVMPFQVWGDWSRLRQPAPRSGSYYCFDQHLWQNEVEECSLRQRAWVAQERILSPRNFYFGSHMVYFQCRDNAASEVFPFSEPQASNPKTSHLYMLSDTSHPMGFRDALDDALSPNSSRQTLYEEWNRFIQYYTVCRLTCDKDIFFALEGLAAECGNRTGDTLVAGLWRSQLPRALCWCVNWDHVFLNWRELAAEYKPVRPVDWRAPTWSWASTRLPIKASDSRGPQHDEPLAEVVSIEDYLDSSRAVRKSGLLRIKSRVYSCRLLSLDEGFKTRWREENVCIFDLGRNKRLRASVSFDESAGISQSFLWTVFIPLIQERLRHGEQNFVVTRGLLLELSETMPGAYHRRGRVTVIDHVPLSTSLKDHVKPGSWVTYDEYDECRGFCTLRII